LGLGGALVLAWLAAPPPVLGQGPASPEPATAEAGCGDPTRTDRVALLIGNGGYDGLDWQALDNPAHDVAQLCRVFGEAGFRVIRLENADIAAARAAIDRFAALSAGADTALVYFAGHGFEYAGNNYLVPVGAPAYASKADLGTRFLPLEQLMASAQARNFNLFFLDACRSYDPVVQLTDADPSDPAGSVSTIGLPRGGRGVVFFSTVKGQPALDDAPPEDDAISPFAAAIAKYSRTPGLELDQYLKVIARDVEERTRSVIDPAQYPVRYGQFREDFYLVPPMADTAQAVPQRPRTGAVRGGFAGMMTAIAPALAALTLDRLATEDEPYVVADLLLKTDVGTLVRAASQRNDPVAQYLLGYMFEFGVGVAQDLGAARTWLERSAAQNHPAGQLELGYFLLHNDPAAAEQARALYEAAAAQGYAKAQSHLGDALWHDAARAADPAAAKALRTRARDLFAAAAEQGHPFAMFALASYGDDPERGRALLAALAQRGNAEGDHWLCELAYGQGREADAGAECLRGASAGFAGSQFIQAMRHARGAGMPVSARDADYWARLALSHKELDPGRRAILANVVLPER